MRPSWDAVWMNVARDVARRSRCSRSQVGCVVVTKDNRVAAVSYNGPPRDLLSWEGKIIQGECDGWCPRVLTGGAPASYDDCVTSHAEMNALVMGDRTAYEGGTIYVTRMPCFTCAKVIANSGVQRVVYLISDDDVKREPERSLHMLHASGLDAIGYHPE